MMKMSFSAYDCLSLSLTVSDVSVLPLYGTTVCPFLTSTRSP